MLDDEFDDTYEAKPETYIPVQEKLETKIVQEDEWPF